MEALILVAVVWWTFAVALVALISTHFDITDRKDVALTIGLSVFWPVTATLALPAIVYQAAVASTSRICIDLRNRGVLREFETWLRERDAIKVLPKEE